MSIRVRPRTEADLPRLADLLAEQQSTSSYPMRWPLPFPVRDFLVRTGEDVAWVAEREGDLLGHVSVAPVVDPALAAAFVAGTGSDRLGIVQVLFSSLAARGTGVGGLLLDTAVEAIRADGRVPVLDVVTQHETALAVYLHRGWVRVGTTRFDWLPEHDPDVLLMALPPYPLASPVEPVSG